jgi:acetoin utilization protein AcuB
MRLRDIMSENVEIIGADATVDQAKELMRRHDIRHLVVIEGGEMAGVLSEHDVRRAEGTNFVRAAMSAPVVTATGSTTLRQGANLMRGNHVSCLPVLDARGQLIGIVTVADLLDLIGKGVTRERADEHRKAVTYVPGR